MSVLAEANPNSLQVLFDLDPLQLTDDNIEAIVRELRAQRERWKQAEAKGRAKKELVKVDLADLGL